MRVNDDESLAGARFYGDLHNGNCQIQCECKHIFEAIDKPGEPCICPECKIELFYRSWWEW